MTIDAEYHGWLERARPLSMYIGAVVASLVAARLAPAYAVWSIVAASIIAPVAVIVRTRATGSPVFLGMAGMRGALVAAAVAIVASATLALGALQLSHGRFPTWSLFALPPFAPRSIELLVVLPNAIAAALVFQVWLQTRIALTIGRWGAVFATAVIYALADRSPFAFLIAIAPAVARAENGSLAACICAYVVLGAIAAFR